MMITIVDIVHDTIIVPGLSSLSATPDNFNPIGTGLFEPNWAQPMHSEKWHCNREKEKLPEVAQKFRQLLY